MSHTPGPWAFEHPNRIISTADRLFDLEADGSVNSLLVATVREGLPVATQETTGCTGANARLIAAAPELLAVLERIMETLAFCEDGREYITDADIQAIADAVRKAKGEPVSS